MNQCRELRTTMAPAVAPNQNLEPHIAFTAACLSHDGRRIAAAGVRTAGGMTLGLNWDDNLTEVWDAKTGTRLAEFTVPGLTPSTIEFSPDDRLILTTYNAATLVRYPDGGRLSTRAASRGYGIPQPAARLPCSKDMPIRSSPRILALTASGS